MKTSRGPESFHLWWMLGCGGLSAGAVWLLYGLGYLPTAVAGYWSLTSLLALVGMWPSFVSFRLGYLNNQHLEPVIGRLSRGRRWLHLLGLSLAFAMMGGVIGLLAGLFIQQAFVGWIPEPIAISLLAFFGSAIASYGTTQVARSLETINLLQIAVLFLTLGICTSMLLNDDPAWWQRSFSYLGDLEGNTFMLFSFTLVVAGILLLSISDFIGYDLDLLAEQQPSLQNRVPYAKWLLFSLAVTIALVGLVPNVVGEIWGLVHNLIARILLVIYFFLMVGSAWLLPNMRRILIFLSSLVVALLIFFYVVMYHLWGYLNVMSFELLSFFVCLGWLYVFVQAIIEEAEKTRGRRGEV